MIGPESYTWTFKDSICSNPHIQGKRSTSGTAKRRPLNRRCVKAGEKNGKNTGDNKEYSRKLDPKSSKTCI